MGQLRTLQETRVTHDAHDFEERLWKALGSDRTVMLGINGLDESHTRPMTAQFEHERGPIWFFTSTDNAMVQALGGEDARCAVRGVRRERPRPVRDDPRQALRGHQS